MTHNAENEEGLTRDPAWSTPGQLQMRHERGDHEHCPATWCEVAAIYKQADEQCRRPAESSVFPPAEPRRRFLMTLVEFLLARIAEDEAWARWAGAAQDAERSRGVAFVSSLGSSSVTSAGRVLAECEAKRRIVALATLPENQALNSPWVDALMSLAMPYADHPDYREEWACL